jgi:hypothetical protein
MRPLGLAALLGLVALPAVAAAAADSCPQPSSEIATDRPDTTNSSLVVPQRSFQQENGVNISRRDGGGPQRIEGRAQWCHSRLKPVDNGELLALRRRLEAKIVIGSEPLARGFRIPRALFSAPACGDRQESAASVEKSAHLTPLMRDPKGLAGGGTPARRPARRGSIPWLWISL